MPYSAVQSVRRRVYPAGPANYWKSSYLQRAERRRPSTRWSTSSPAVPRRSSAVVIEHLGGAVGRVGQDATAFTHRGAPYNLIVIGEWTDPADAERNIRWTRDCWQAMRPFATAAVYVNYLDATRAGPGPGGLRRRTTRAWRR